MEPPSNMTYKDQGRSLEDLRGSPPLSRRVTADDDADIMVVQAVPVPLEDRPWSPPPKTPDGGTPPVSHNNNTNNINNNSRRKVWILGSIILAVLVAAGVGAGVAVAGGGDTDARVVVDEGTPPTTAAPTGAGTTPPTPFPSVVPLQEDTLWMLRGTILGTQDNDEMGTGVAISADASVLAYNEVLGRWEQIGTSIELGTDQGDSVKLSADGTRLVVGSDFSGVGAAFNTGGVVRVFALRDDDWIQIGDDVLGVADFDRWGSIVDISADGRVFVAGASANDDNDRSAGHVRIFEAT